MDEFDPRPALVDFSHVEFLLTTVGAHSVTWGGSTAWSRRDALERLLAHIAGGGTWIARRPGEFARSEDASAPNRRWKHPIIGPALAVRYLYFPYKPPRSAVRAFAEATISELDAVRALELPLSRVIVRVGGVQIGGRWFFSRVDVLRKANRPEAAWLVSW